MPELLVEFFKYILGWVGGVVALMMLDWGHTRYWAIRERKPFQRFNRIWLKSLWLKYRFFLIGIMLVDAVFWFVSERSLCLACW